MTERTFRDFWEQRVALTPDAPFVHHAADTWTYAGFDASINRLANGLRDAGIGAGSKVALYLDNSFELLRRQWALQKLGAIWVPIIPSSTRSEATYVLEHAEVDAMIAGAEQWGRLDSPRWATRTFVEGGGNDGVRDVASLETDDATAPPPTGIDPMDPMALMYTSGSTGKPKGVLQPSAGYQTAARAYIDRMEITADDVWICTVPLFHTGGTHLMLAPTIGAGASLVLVPRFSVSGFWPKAREHGATLALLFTAQISMLMSLPDDPGDLENDLRLSISHVVNPAFTERYGVEILTTFSQTESLGLGVMTPPGSRDVGTGVVGPAMPPELEIRVFDPDDEEVPRGERGEICLRHPHLMLGYHRDPENTRLALRGGWLHTGDIGTMDDRGWLTFQGRLKNVIKRMGENIAGEEIEFALMRHPDVEEAVVCGVPDPIRTEEVYAVVHCREGRRPDVAALIAWVGTELSAWKLPRYVRVEPAPFPRLPNGKLDRMQMTRDVDPAGAWDREAHLARPDHPA